MKTDKKSSFDKSTMIKINKKIIGALENLDKYINKLTDEMAKELLYNINVDVDGDAVYYIFERLEDKVYNLLLEHMIYEYNKPGAKEKYPALFEDIRSING